MRLLRGWPVSRSSLWPPVAVIGAAMGLNDPADPGGDNDAGEIGGPLPAAPIEMAHSGAARR